jgi:hypothetical protein
MATCDSSAFVLSLLKSMVEESSLPTNGINLKLRSELSGLLV